MRYFLAYHNADRMGYSSTAIRAPSVKTSKPVGGLEGSVVWLVGAEGKSLKSYYLASRFVVDKCEPNKYPGTDLPNVVSGKGVLFGTRICLDSTPLLDELRRYTANFVRGFGELHDSALRAALERLAK